MADTVIAQAILRSVGGSSILTAPEPVTARTISQYQIPDSVVEEASQKLAARGFQVLDVGPAGITLSGDRELFERVFSTQLELRNAPQPESGRYFVPVTPMVIPDDLSPVVAGVALSVPPVFYP